MRAILQMKPSSAPLPIVLVGGGAVLAPDDLGPPGMTYRPKHSGVANAIGAAIAQIGGESERFVSYALKPRQAAIADVVADATAKATAAGAAPASISVADIEEVAIPYMDDGAHRVRVKVVGDIAALRRLAE